ncbi:MAG TPA: DUF294 nucleotidyltransferase-like domain-containing protein [Dermatophilaceae bacterium]|nr:DUF294 nucleotidyltransferase-like domain-containing protein [Dermatophilaceae bacterium]
MTGELSEVRDFLAQHVPFADLPGSVLDVLSGRLSMQYFRRGTRILSVGQDNDVVYMLRSGAIDVHDPDGALIDRGDVGTCFGSDTLIHGNPYQYQVTAIEDCLVFVLPAEVFTQLSEDHPGFAAYFRRLHGRMQEAVASVQLADNGVAVLRTRVGDMVRHEALVVPPTTTIRAAAEQMRRAKTASALVMDGMRLLGIVTNTDLRDRVIADGRDSSGPLTDIMSTNVVTAQAESLAVELLLEMVSRNVHHIPVFDGARVAGVVGTGDLIRLQHANPVVMAADIANQDTVEDLVATSRRLPQILEQLVSEDATAEAIGRVVTAVGDTIERRLLALAEKELGSPPQPYCWVVLGSQARMEQGLASDQDNAIILPDGVAKGDLGYYEALAERVSSGLEACGYSRCPGDVMATNPQWRQTLSAWKRTFASWMTKPEPTAVLHAQIFFDMRALHGDAGLFNALREPVLAAAPGSRVFLAHLAKQAVEQHPPLGFFRGFVLEKAGDRKSTLDLKIGAGAIVQLARVHALTSGLAHVNTQARLSAEVSGGLLDEERKADLRDAFEFISYVRLRHQGHRARAGGTPDNFVPPSELTNFEKQHLRDAFQIVRRAQSTVASGFLVHYVS